MYELIRESGTLLTLQEDIALATDAMNKLQGAVLPSSERGGIRIEYARSKMADSVSRTSSHDRE
jgi:hypothetical protein